MDRQQFLRRFKAVRQASLRMCKPLEEVEYRIQVAESASPPWWNLGHTSWFFAQLLAKFSGEVTGYDELFGYLLNSYYSSLGEKIARDLRGSVTRPTVAEIKAYRKSVDQRIKDLIFNCSNEMWVRLYPLLEMGLQHEQQHQELFYTEIKWIRFHNLLSMRLPYVKAKDSAVPDIALPLEWVPFKGGLYEFGNLEGGFGWDNEYGLHSVYLADFSLSNRLITVGEYAEFMEADGYNNELLWLSEGWRQRCAQGWKAPMYWENTEGEWRIWTLSGMRHLLLAEPICHINFYEAQAFLTWKRQQSKEWQNVRLPTEFELQHAMRLVGKQPDSNFLETGLLHPTPLQKGEMGMQLFGNTWEWTGSVYGPYPSYKPYDGFLAEYNGKFHV